MKKIILLVLVSIFVFANGNSAILDLKTKALTGDPAGGNGPKRAPLLVPVVDQEGHCIYFQQCNYQNAILQITKAGTVVYSVVVATDIDQIQLPDSLQGDYEFDLICGNYCFYSDITL